MTEEQNGQQEQQQEPARPTYKVSSGIPTPEEYEAQSFAPAPVEAEPVEAQVEQGNDQVQGEQAPLEENQASFSMPSFDGESNEGEEGEAAANIIDWKEELKKANPKDILKELGYDDFVAEFAEFRKNGGDAYKYLEAKAFDWETVNHQDLVLDELKLQYPHLADDKIEKLYQAKYKLSEYASEEDKEVGLIQLEADAELIRQKRIVEQKAFQIPELSRSQEAIEVQNRMAEQQEAG